MMDDIPKKHPIEDIYKDKKIKKSKKKDDATSPSKKGGQSKKQKRENNKEINKSNEEKDLSENRKKRRQPLTNIYSVIKKDEQNEGKEEENDDEEKNVNEKENEDNNNSLSSRMLKSILEFEDSYWGNILMIFLGIVNLLFYDLSKACISYKYKYIILGITALLTLYIILDLIFRNILLEKSSKSFYFAIQVIACIFMLFDFSIFSYTLLQTIFYKDSKKRKYLLPEQQEIILYVLSLLQILKHLRIIKIYIVTNKFLRKVEKDKKINEK